ncbi:MAG: response regulator [Spirochaetia bacterium]|nr:response regulator [Spirochaetia bacterium]
MNTVLIAEDDDSIRNDVSELFNYEGFHALEAKNGREAVDMAIEKKPDIIVCDIMMPEKNGFQVLKELRQNSETSLTPFIFLTAKASIKDTRKGMSEGADDYIVKPFAMKDLLEAVNIRLKKTEAMRRKEASKLKEFRENIVHSLPHELLTPLNGILGFSQLLSINFHIMEREEIGEMAQITYESALQLNRIVQNYLLLAQLEIIFLDKKKIKDLRMHILHNSKDIIEKTFLEKADEYKRRNDIEFSIENAVLPISGNDLKKAISELTDNAFKFSRASEKVNIFSSVKNDLYAIKIHNQGKEFQKSKIDQIRDIKEIGGMFQGKNGLGLGLLIVSKYMEIYNGKIEIHSEPEKGTEITLYFPIVK